MAVTVAVVGYASADRPVTVDSLPAADTTAIVRERLGSSWPRLGGCGPQIAVGLSLRGVSADCVSWVADDELGRSLRSQLEEAGAGVRGVRVGGARTAESYLVYDRDGRTLCFFDPGGAPADDLTRPQREVVASADVVCLSVAPKLVTRAALAAANGSARLVWSVKADPDAYPPGLVRELLARADVVWHSRGEAAFLAERAPEAGARPEALVIETHGSDGVSWRRGAGSGRETTPHLRVADTTGAGDALVAGSLAQFLNDPTDSAGAVRAGIAASRALLESRVAGDKEK